MVCAGGTPTVRYEGSFDPIHQTYSLHLTQSRADLPGHPPYEPMPIPVRLGLLDRDGGETPLRLGHDEKDAPTERVLVLRDREETLVFHGVRSEPVPSLFRGFSAPVRVETDVDDRELAFRFARDTDPFNRWDAGQALAERILMRAIQRIRAGDPATFDEAYVEAHGRLIADGAADPSWRALAMTLPSERVLAQRSVPVDPSAIHEAREGCGERWHRAFAASSSRSTTRATWTSRGIPSAPGGSRTRRWAPWRRKAATTSWSWPRRNFSARRT
ncbi:MAG: DUF3458 domain-containing protein [Myxococcales bacterium]|nr:DUF3458 domain-containing protein [Myxococcales bacterium]